MGQRIDQFCENLRQKLTMTDSGLDGLKAKIDGKAARVEQDVQSHLDRVQKRIEQGRAKVSAAQAEMKKALGIYSNPDPDHRAISSIGVLILTNRRLRYGPSHRSVL